MEIESETEEELEEELESEAEELESETEELESETEELESETEEELEEEDPSTDQSADVTIDQPIINSQEDIWTCWKLHLNDDSLHKYSLERLGIIQCGNKSQCPDFYSTELYNLLIYKPSTSVNPVVSLILYLTRPLIGRLCQKSYMKLPMKTNETRKYTWWHLFSKSS